MKTYSPSVKTISRKWHIFDAKGQTLGRLSTQISKVLIGKLKTDFTKHLDIADHVVVINASQIVVTGSKDQQKVYHHHSGYPGGMRVVSYQTMLDTHPDRIITHAVSGMLPNNKLRDKILKHLHVYATSEHPYKSQFKQ